MSVDNNDDELVATRAKIETSKPKFKPYTATLSSSSSTPRTASKYALYPSAAVYDALTPFPKGIKNIESMQEGVQKMRSEGASSVSYVPTSYIITVLRSRKI